LAEKACRGGEKHSSLLFVSVRDKEKSFLTLIPVLQAGAEGRQVTTYTLGKLGLLHNKLL